MSAYNWNFVEICICLIKDSLLKSNKAIECTME